jgi:hypothetical protein
MARVSSRNDLAIISLICNVEKTSIIMRETFEVSNIAAGCDQVVMIDILHMPGAL